MQIVRVEHEQADARHRGDVGRAIGRAAAPRLAEEVPGAEPHGARPAASISTSPAAMKYMRMRLVAAPRDQTAPGSTVCARSSLHDVGDLAGFELGEERHPRDHAPGDDEVAPVDLVGEGGRDDADRQRHHDEAAKMVSAGDQLAERR